MNGRQRQLAPPPKVLFTLGNDNMHELYATQAILDRAVQKAGEQNAQRITDVHIHGRGDFNLQR